MGRLSRVIAVALVLPIAAVLVVSASGQYPTSKAHQTVVPQYVNGYWPGDNPQLCILDLTYSEYPVTQAVAEFDDVVGIDLHVTSRMVACLPGESIVRVAATDRELPCGEGHGCWVRSDGSFRDADGLWVHSSGSYIALDSTIRDRADHDQWVALISHEIGHALGLGHTNRADSVMRASVFKGDTVTTTDVAVLDDLYSDR